MTKETSITEINIPRKKKKEEESKKRRSRKNLRKFKWEIILVDNFVKTRERSKTI